MRNSKCYMKKYKINMLKNTEHTIEDSPTGRHRKLKERYPQVRQQQASFLGVRERLNLVE